MAEPTSLYLPRELPYPITVVELHAQPDTPVTQGTRLLTYSWLSADVSDNNEPAPDPKAMPPPKATTKLFGTWDCPIGGTLTRWSLKPGEVIGRDRARQKPALYATEPCKHGVQMGGLCALCGKDMTKCVHIYHIVC